MNDHTREIRRIIDSLCKRAVGPVEQDRIYLETFVDRFEFREKQRKDLVMEKILRRNLKRATVTQPHVLVRL